MVEMPGAGVLYVGLQAIKITRAQTSLLNQRFSYICVRYGVTYKFYQYFSVLFNGRYLLPSLLHNTCCMAPSVLLEIEPRV